MERFETDTENMMEMHDMGPEIPREAQQVPSNRLRIAIGQQEVVVVVRVK
jgi:hypothetical protein